MDVSEDIHISDESETESLWEINEISYESPSSNEVSDQLSGPLNDDLEPEEYKSRSNIDDIQVKDDSSSVFDDESITDIVDINPDHESESESSPSVYLTDPSDDEYSIEDDGSIGEEVTRSVKSSPAKHQSPSKWVPQIGSVTKATVSGVQEAVKDNSHLVLIPEDTIKKEEFVDESEDLSGINEKLSTASHSNISIKLEKLDFSNVSNEDIAQLPVKKRGRPLKRNKRTGKVVAASDGKTGQPLSGSKSKLHSNQTSMQSNGETSSKEAQAFRNSTYEFRNVRQRNGADRKADSDRRSLRLSGKSAEKNEFAMMKGRTLKRKDNLKSRGSENRTTSSVDSDEGNCRPILKKITPSRKTPDWAPLVKLKPVDVTSLSDNLSGNRFSSARKRRHRSLNVLDENDYPAESSDSNTSFTTTKKKVRFSGVMEKADCIADNSDSNANLGERKLRSSDVALQKDSTVDSSDWNSTLTKKRKLSETPAQTDDKVNSNNSNAILTKNRVTTPNSETKKPRPALTANRKKKSKLKFANPTDELKKNFPSQQCEDFRKTIDVWYECMCCDQKFHLLEQVREHVRGHFPDVCTG